MHKVKTILQSILILIILQGCTPSNPHSVRKSINDEKKVLLKKEGPEEFFYWEIEDDKSVWSMELGAVIALNAYKDSLLIALGDDRYKKALKKESTQNLDKGLINNEENGDRINAILVHSGSIGNIRQINYLESEILDYQIDRFPMFSHPTEFHAFIIKNKKTNKIRITR